MKKILYVLLLFAAAACGPTRYTLGVEVFRPSGQETQTGGQWRLQQFTLLYFDSVKWYDALEYAEQFQWKKAMDVWFGLLDSNDVLKRSAAAYDIAVACHIAGDNELALKWLDRSDKENKLPDLSEALRRKIGSGK